MYQRLKRLICLVLTLCLIAASGLASAAPENTSFWVSLYQSIDHQCRAAAVCGELVYLLDENCALYRYTPGDAEPVLMDETLVDYMPSQDKNAATGSLSRLFTVDGQLYAMEFDTGWVWRLVDAGGAVDIAPLYRLDMSFNADAGNYFTSVVYMDGYLYLHASYEDKLYQFSLEDGVEPTSMEASGLQALTPYKDGLLIATTTPYYDEVAPIKTQLVTYDPATQQKTLLSETDIMGGRAIAYDPAGDVVFYASDYTIYALNQPDAKAVPCAYLMNNVNAGGLNLLSNGQLFVTGYSGVYISTPDMDGVEAQPLTVAGEYGSEAHRAAMLSHPEITVLPTELSTDLQTLTAAILSGDTNLDMMRLQLDNAPVTSLMDKGYLVDLSAYPELMAIVEHMDQRLIVPLTRDGKLYAVPIEMNGQYLTVNTEVWTETLGLSLDELPTTYPELLDFIANYMYDYGEDHEDLLLMDAWDMRSDLLYILLQSEAAAQLRDGIETVSFDTPRFRRLLDALDVIDFSDISLSELMGENATDADYDEIYSKELLFTVSYRLAPEAYAPYNDTWLPLLLQLDESTPPVISTGLSVLCISSRSAHPELAAQYLTAYLSNLQPTNEAVSLFPDRNEAVPNLSYETDVANIKREIKKMEAALDTAAPENRAQLEENLRSTKDYLPMLEDRRYLLTAETIASYREKMAPVLYPVSQAVLSLFSSDEADANWSLFNQYVSQAIDADAFVKELSSRIRLMQLESH